MDDGGLEHRTGLLVIFVGLAGAGVAVMVGFATVTSLVWPIIAGGVATAVGACGAVAVLWRLWPFQRRPDPFKARLEALLAEGTNLRGPVQQPPSGPPAGDADAVQAWDTKVREALAGRPQQLASFNFDQGGLGFYTRGQEEVRRYRKLATRINNLERIIAQLNAPPPPPPIVLPPPTFIPPVPPDQTLPHM